MKAGDTITPKGIVPVLSRWLGSFWVGYSILAGLAGLYWAWESASQQYPLPELIVRLLPGALGITLMVLPLSLPGLLFAGLFPTVRVNNRGIEYRSLFMRGLVRWPEIETIARVRQPTECLAIVISRPLAILTGLWFASLHGQMVGLGKPVVLLSVGWEYREELLREIHAQQAAISVPVNISPPIG